jgi:hypothetical protein
MTQQHRKTSGTPSDAGDPRVAREARDPGAYIGREPERVAESIPGGLGPRDERASAVATQSGPQTHDEAPPEGHREGRPATDSTVREAGQNR